MHTTRMAKINVLIGGLQVWLASSTQFRQSLRRLHLLFAIQTYYSFSIEFFIRPLFKYSSPLTPVEELQLVWFTQNPLSCNFFPALGTSRSY